MGWKRTRRLIEVEKRLHSEGWTGSWIDDVATLADCSRRTVERDRIEVLERLKGEEIGDLETRRARALLELRRDRKGARGAGKWAAVIRAAALEARLLGLDQVPPARPQPEQEVIPGETALDRQLRETLQLRRDAQSRGSMVAAARLLVTEAELLTQIEEKQRAAEERRKLSADEEALIARFEAAIAKLPGEVAARLAERMSTRAEG